MTDEALTEREAEEVGLLPEAGNIVDSGGALLCDIAAERQLIGLLLTHPDRIDAAIAEVNDRDFFDAFHRIMFATFMKGHDEGWICDSEAIIKALGGDRAAKIFGEFTAAQYLGRLIIEANPAHDVGEVAAYLQGLSERRATQIVDDREFQANMPFVSKMGLKLWRDQNEKAQEYEYLVEDLIPENEGCLVIGDTGTGKSFLVEHLALCGARGEAFFGRRIMKPFGTIWFAYEAGRGQTARMRAYAKYYNVKEADLPFAVLTHPLPLWPDPKAMQETVNEIRGIQREFFGDIPLGLSVFDTYNAATPGASEIDSEVVSKIRKGFDFIRAETGCSTLIVGHTNASGKHRGNEQLTNNIDTVLVVRRKTHLIDRQPVPWKDDDGREVRTVRVQKQREGQDGDEIDFVLQVVEDGTFNKFGKPRTSCVVTPPKILNPGNDDPEAGSKTRGQGKNGAVVSKAESTFVEALLASLDDFGIAPPPELGLPRSIGKVVEYERVKLIVSQKLLREEDDTDEGRKTHRERVRKSLKRSREGMMHIRVIGCHDPYIWWTGKAVDGIPATYSKKPDLFDDGAPPVGDVSDFY